MNTRMGTNINNIIYKSYMYSSNDSTCKCTRTKKTKTHNGPEKHGGSRTLVLQGLRPLQPKPNMADTHSHHWDHKNTFNFAPTRSLIRWHWASPSPFALFGTPKTAQPMYTPISPFHPQIITIKSKTCHYQAK